MKNDRGGRGAALTPISNFFTRPARRPVAAAACKAVAATPRASSPGRLQQQISAFLSAPRAASPPAAVASRVLPAVSPDTVGVAPPACSTTPLGGIVAVKPALCPAPLEVVLLDMLSSGGRGGLIDLSSALMRVCSPEVRGSRTRGRRCGAQCPATQVLPTATLCEALVAAALERGRRQTGLLHALGTLHSLATLLAGAADAGAAGHARCVAAPTGSCLMRC